MNNTERELFWKKYWESFCKSLLSIYSSFAVGTVLIVIGWLNSDDWKTASTKAVISIGMIGVIIAVGIPVAIFFALRKRYKAKK